MRLIMLFNSVEFFIFFPLVTALYFLLPHKARWFLLITASVIFYTAFIPQYILILLVTIIIDYIAGLRIENSTGRQKKVWLWASVISTCLVLFIFKYFNFFNANFAAIADLLHWNYSIGAFRLLLPIGLSFHTFQSLSYVIEVYRGRQKAEHHFGIYSLYVMFYPQLVAGPIERPQNLLHQFYERHDFDYDRVTTGLKLMLWGLFQKVVIADSAATIVNFVYDQPHNFTGLPLVIATVLFAFQIYGDFAGYSNIAIGSALVMGFRLSKNFDRPYLSKSVSEFWKRWHMSLSTWFRDYLYIPLGGNRVVRHLVYLNLFITFVVSGFWHGANWTYIIWGALNGLYLIIEIATNRWREKLSQVSGLADHPTLRKSFKTIITFSLICFAWIFFRAKSLSEAWYIVTHLFTGDFFSLNLGVSLDHFALIALLIVFLIVVELWQRQDRLRLALARQPIWVRWPIYYAAIALIVLFLNTSPQMQFIYFQF